MLVFSGPAVCRRFALALLTIGLAGPLRAQEMQYPLAVAAADGETLYVADRDLPGIWQIAGGAPQVFFAGLKQLKTPLNAPRALALDQDGRLLAADSATREVYRFSAEGAPQPLTASGIGIPMGIAVEKSGDLLVSDLELHCIWRVPAGGGTPSKLTDISAPRGVCLDGKGRLWVVSRGADELLRVSTKGKVEVVVKGRVFGFAHDVALDAHGVAYISDGYGHAIWKVEPDKAPVVWVEGDPLVNPVGLAWQGKDLLVADPRAKAIFRIDPAGKVSPVKAESAN